MKFALAALALVSFSASAEPESYSLLCTGTQQLIGGVKTGTFVLQASTPGTHTHGDRWKIEASWQGEGPIVTSGVACGQNLQAGAQCYESRSLSNVSPFQLHQECGKTIHRGSVAHSEFISQIVLNANQQNGYFNCESPKQHLHIQLTNCKAPSPMMAFAEASQWNLGNITVCGKFRDNGDTFQILDGKLNPYVDGSDTSLPDPNGVQNWIYADKPQGKSYCVTGEVQKYSRGSNYGYKFVSLNSVRRN